ncbi:MAG: NADH-quinone oxidoreductase subunit L, partial [Candidatus Kapaibacteriota bacterium]
SSGNTILWIILVISAFFTAFYMYRLLMLVFLGKERFDKHHLHPHESPKIMTIPLQILAILSAIGGFVGIPYALGFWLGEHSNLFEHWLEPIFADANKVFILSSVYSIHLPNQIHIEEYILMVLSVVVALVGILLAAKFYSDEELSTPKNLATNFKSLYLLLYNKYRIDEIYFYLIVDPLIYITNKFLWKIIDSKIIDGIVNGSATLTVKISEILRRIQTGLAQNYALVMFVGTILLLLWILVGF